MSVGEGIFWGAFVLGMVALFLGTKDRWSWKRIAARSVVALVSLGTLAAAGVYIAEWYGERPQVVSTYWGIALGAPRADVRYSRGEPSSVSGEDRWVYRPSDEFAVYVDFKQDKVSSVLAVGNRTYMPNIGNINTYVSMDDLIKSYGSPSAVTTSDDGLTRTLNFHDYNVVVSFNKDGVVGGGIDADLSKPRTFENAKGTASAAETR